MLKAARWVKTEVFLMQIETVGLKVLVGNKFYM